MDSDKLLNKDNKKKKGFRGRNTNGARKTRDKQTWRKRGDKEEWRMKYRYEKERGRRRGGGNVVWELRNRILQSRKKNRCVEGGVWLYQYTRTKVSSKIVGIIIEYQSSVEGLARVLYSMILILWFCESFPEVTLSYFVSFITFVTLELLSSFALAHSLWFPYL